MKDLIMILAYTPDELREDILRKLVGSLAKFKETFDVMVVSHTPIPVDVQKKVDVAIFDKKNEILTDWDLLNQPWFNPGNDRRIQSSFLSKKNTHLAIWRMLNIGFSNARNLGYQKVHHIEYDCNIENIDEFVENSKYLDFHDAVIYIKHEQDVDDILYGSCQSYRIDKLDPILTDLDEEKIKDFIRSSDTKSPEQMLQALIQKNNGAYIKDSKVLNEKGNSFGLIDGQVSFGFNPWSVPFYDRLTEQVYFLVWNTTKHQGVKHIVLVNEQKAHAGITIEFNHWIIIDLGRIEEIESIIVLEDGKIRDTFSLKTQEEKEIFKKMSFRTENRS